MANFKVSIPQFETTLEVRRGFSILDEALKAGLDYPYACRQGNCSSCKSILRKGTVTHKTYDPTALTEAEKFENIILACRAMPTSDCEVEFIEDADTFTPAKYECVVTSIDRVSSEIAILKAKPCTSPSPMFSAGQFATLTFPNLPAREYSFANRPGAAELEFHIEYYKHGKVSKHVYEKCKPSDRFVLNAPFGSAYLRKEHPGPITMVVGGTGLAPAKSILLDALASMPGHDIRIYHSAREAKGLYQNEEMLKLAEKYPRFGYFPVITRANGIDAARTTDVFIELRRHFETLQGHKIYTCGSPGLVANCQKFAMEMGVTPSDCHADPFVSASTMVVE
ncbi:2Fe-2S iron-sulfur cluster-binding protein [Hyphomicrobium facile]|uniref:CDP-4-dehydro-6-deoxyglucose reductase n=1 Tax=Hyphomicrobium facile TaxID=51670 RepID=A0A1I7NDW1_9HYPH|nr:2Fe-2S iron-sulfur cluster-binding protein [Hyphomicrobium facile]SFV32865.1 CDP-4-dehydro-6-deoxyglucose reductase [Hyphomicrobium facile]